ncbi:hypothetical protein Tco_0650333 [Tanacetum coccineum]
MPQRLTKSSIYSRSLGLILDLHLVLLWRDKTKCASCVRKKSRANPSLMIPFELLWRNNLSHRMLWKWIRIAKHGLNQVWVGKSKVDEMDMVLLSEFAGELCGANKVRLGLGIGGRKHIQVGLGRGEVEDD